MQKQTNANIVVITSLTILLIGSIIMGLLIAYFSNNPNLTASAPLCTDATIVATKNGSTVYSFVLPEDAISYANYQQQIKILTDDNFPNSYVRLKLSINNNENLTVLANDKKL